MHVLEWVCTFYREIPNQWFWLLSFFLGVFEVARLKKTHPYERSPGLADRRMWNPYFPELVESHTPGEELLLVCPGSSSTLDPPSLVNSWNPKTMSLVDLKETVIVALITTYY